MNASRLEQLLKFENEDPDDPFTLYAIASEYQNTEPEKALQYYSRLITSHENYTGTYYQLGKFYESLNRKEDAKNIYKKGYTICITAGKVKAAAEIKSALNLLEDEEEDY